MQYLTRTRVETTPKAKGDTSLAWWTTIRGQAQKGLKIAVDEQKERILGSSLWGSDPLLEDTDADGLDDMMEVEDWFTYEKVSLDKLFFDNEGLAKLNLTLYYLAHFKATIHTEVRTNITTEQDIPDSLVIEIVEENEWMSTLTELEYTTFYDSSGLDDSYTKISVLYNFSFDNLDGESTWIYMSPNPEVFPENLGDFEVYLDYVVVKILGSDVASGDTDGDGLSDYSEIQTGTSISKMDTDSDRITDNAERIYWFGIVGMPDYEEAEVMRNADVDDDGLLDGYEVIHGTDPDEADEDNDLLLDKEEVQAFVTAMRHNLTDPSQNPPLVNQGTFVHQFALSAKGEYLFKLTILNVINRSIDYYDEDLIYEEDYMETMNTWFMNNSSVVKYCHDPWMASEYCREVKYDSRAIIVNVSRYQNLVNTSERRHIFIFQNISKPASGFGAGQGFDIYKVKYELNVLELGTVVVANFTEFLGSRKGVHPFKADFDGDGVSDGIEVNRGSNPFFLHSDEDMLTDYDEFVGTYGALTNLTEEDTDRDGLWDGYNIESGLTILHYGELSYNTNGTKPDTDGDDLLDWEEIRSHNTSSLRLDSDNDYISDWSESNEDQRPGINGNQFTDPVDSDTDDDELMDNDLTDTDPTTPDSDSDGLMDGEEFRLQTMTDDPDSDDDGLLDGYNMTVDKSSDLYNNWKNDIYYDDIGGNKVIFIGELSLGTKPTIADSDGDELEDGEEWDDGTSYLNFDTDYDGLLDGADLQIQQTDERYQLFVDRGIVDKDGKFKGEVTAGSTPTDVDTDGDGLPDGWEVKFGLSPTDDGSANEDHGPLGDFDEDEVSNMDEFNYSTNPANDDTDGDDLEDGWEILYGLNPLHDGSHIFILKKNYDYVEVGDTSPDDGANGDPDEDGVLNSVEQSRDTSPITADTDLDGLLDGQGFPVSTESSMFKLWASQGIPYVTIDTWTVEFIGESEYSTDPLDPDCDNDMVADGQEVLGYNVTISWFEGEELKSENRTIFGHPWGPYKKLEDNSTLLDVDEDGISDFDEMDR